MKGFNKGQTLIELVLAIGIAAVVLTGITKAAIVALKNAQYSRDQALMTKYAQEGMEKARQLRDSGWQNILDNVGSECGLTKNGAWDCPVCPATPNIDNKFIRCVQFNDTADPDRIEVRVTVSWDSHRSELTSFLTKWAH